MPKKGTPKSKIILVACLVALAVSTGFLAYQTYSIHELYQDSQRQLRNITVEKQALEERLANLAKKEKMAESLAQSLIEAYVPVPSVKYVSREKRTVPPELILTFGDMAKYGLDQKIWDSFKMKLSWGIFDEKGKLLSPLGELAPFRERTYRLPPSGVSLELPVGSYQLRINATMDGNLVSSRQIVFLIQKDERPPYVQWKAPRPTDDSRTVSVEVIDQESGVDSVLLMVRRLTPQPDKSMRVENLTLTPKQVPPSTFLFDLEQVFGRREDGLNMTIVFWVEAKDYAENKARSEPVYVTLSKGTIVGSPALVYVLQGWLTVADSCETYCLLYREDYRGIDSSRTFRSIWATLILTTEAYREEPGL